MGEKRKRDGNMGGEAGERTENNRGEHGGRLSCSSHSFSISASFSPNPLPQSKEYQFCRHCSDAGTLNGMLGSVSGGVGKTSKAPLLNPLLIYILHFVSFW